MDQKNLNTTITIPEDSDKTKIISRDSDKNITVIIPRDSTETEFITGVKDLRKTPEDQSKTELNIAIKNLVQVITHILTGISIMFVLGLVGLAIWGLVLLSVPLGLILIVLFIMICLSVAEPPRYRGY